MAKTQTRAWDVADHLKTNEDLNSHLEAALEDGDPGLIFAVLGHITRARNLRPVGLAEKQPQCLFQKSPLFLKPTASWDRTFPFRWH